MELQVQTPLTTCGFHPSYIRNKYGFLLHTSPKTLKSGLIQKICKLTDLLNLDFIYLIVLRVNKKIYCNRIKRIKNQQNQGIWIGPMLFGSNCLTVSG